MDYVSANFSFSCVIKETAEFSNQLLLSLIIIKLQARNNRYTIVVFRQVSNAFYYRSLNALYCFWILRYSLEASHQNWEKIDNFILLQSYSILGKI